MGVKRNLEWPEHIKQVWFRYNGEETRKVLAMRSAPEWFAVLFEEPSGALVAVDFTGYGTNFENWQVSNDGIEFESVQQFKTEKLTMSFL